MYANLIQRKLIDLVVKSALTGWWMAIQIDVVPIIVILKKGNSQLCHNYIYITLASYFPPLSAIEITFIFVSMWYLVYYISLHLSDCRSEQVRLCLNKRPNVELKQQNMKHTIFWICTKPEDLVVEWSSKNSQTYVPYKHVTCSLVALEQGRVLSILKLHFRNITTQY